MIEQPVIREGSASALPSTVPSHLLVTISTPTCTQPIARLGSKQELLAGATIRQIIERSISLRSPFSQGVPVEQLESEMTTVLAIGELLASGTAEVVSKDPEGGPEFLVGLNEPAQSAAQEHIDEQGGVFWTLTLEVRTAGEASLAPENERRRFHAEAPRPAPTAPAAKPEPTPAASGNGDAHEPAPSAQADPAKNVVVIFDGRAGRARTDQTPAVQTSAPVPTPVATSPAPPPAAPPVTEAPAAPPPVTAQVAPSVAAPPVTAQAAPPAAAPPVTPQAAPPVDVPPAPVEEISPAPEVAPPPAAPAQTAIAALPAAPVATLPTPPQPAEEAAAAASKAKQPAAAGTEQKGYIRKTDALRAQFLPEVEGLDLSGLFVAEFGLAIRQEREVKNVVLADPSRITDTLLQGNGFRRAGNTEKALACYQELVDMDPSNADFRFLCGTMLKALGREEQALDAFLRARELGHEGAQKEIDEIRKGATGSGDSRRILGFLKFWKQ